jgi:hypothetical protein
LAVISLSACVPADALVLAVHQLHRVAQAEFAVAVLAQRGALGAVRAQVDGRIEHRLLAHPDAVLDHGVDRAADRAVRADGALDLDAAFADGRGLVASAAFAFFTSVSCVAAMPTPTPRPERRRKARRSIVGIAFDRPRCRLWTKGEAPVRRTRLGRRARGLNSSS